MERFFAERRLGRRVALGHCRVPSGPVATRHPASGAAGAWSRDQRADASAGNARRGRRRQTAFPSPFLPPSTAAIRCRLLLSSRACARGSEKDQDQPIDLPRFRSRNAANSSEIGYARPNSLRTGKFLQFNRECSRCSRAVFSAHSGRFEHREFSLFGARRGDTPVMCVRYLFSSSARPENLGEHAVEAHFFGQAPQRADAAVFETQAGGRDSSRTVQHDGLSRSAVLDIKTSISLCHDV